MENQKMYEKFFQKRLITNTNTKKTYIQGIKKYFDFLNKKPEEYFNNGTDYEEDIQQYYLHIKETLPPLSVANRMNSIKMFITTNDRNTKNLEIWDTITLRLRGSRESVTEEKILNHENLKRILQFGDICTRAIFLISISSGARIESVLGLLQEDMHINEEPARIVYPMEITKGKKHKITSFITPEAVEAYNLWMTQRDKRLAEAVNHSYIDPKWKTDKHGKIIKVLDENGKLVKVLNENARNKKKADDKRVFPYDYENIRIAWVNMVKKAGLHEVDSKTNRSTAHIHTLRRFFRSNLGDVDLAEICMGHKGYLSQYRQFTDAQLAEKYKEKMHNIMIFETTSKDITDLNSRMQEKEKRIDELEKKLDEVNQSMLILLARNQTQH